MDFKQKVFSYENIVVAIFFFVVGFLFLDQMTVSYLMPLITKELQLNNTQVGQIGMWQIIGFALASPFFGFLSDKLGKRKIIIAMAVSGIAVFSFLILFVDSFAALLTVRIFAGMSEGIILPVVYAVLQPVSGSHYGRNVGLVTAGAALIASTLGPVMMTQLSMLMNWRYCFLVISIPSLVLVLLVMKLIHETATPESALPGEAKPQDMQQFRYIDVLRQRNVILSGFIGILYLAGMWIMMQFTPLYLTEVGKTPLDMMGVIMSVNGLMAVFWQVFVHSISDRLGRKPVLLGAFFLALLVPLLLFVFPEGWISKVVLVLFYGNCIGLTPLLLGVIAVESVPPNLAASASALITGISQFVSAFFLGTTGRLADIYGLSVVMLTAAAAYVCAILLGLALKETNARKVKTGPSY